MGQTTSINLNYDVISTMLLYVEYDIIHKFLHVNKYFNSKVKTKNFREVRLRFSPTARDCIVHQDTIMLINKIKNNHGVCTKLSMEYADLYAKFGVEKSSLESIISTTKFLYLQISLDPKCNKINIYIVNKCDYLLTRCEPTAENIRFYERMGLYDPNDYTHYPNLYKCVIEDEQLYNGLYYMIFRSEIRIFLYKDADWMRIPYVKGDIEDVVNIESVMTDMKNELIRTECNETLYKYMNPADLERFKPRLDGTTAK